MPSATDVDLSRADLLSLGTVCASPDCGTRDFLPFRCSFCRKVYCLEHKSHAGCGPESTRVLVCPVCAKAVKLPSSKNNEEITEEAAAAAFDLHARSMVGEGKREGEKGRGRRKREGERKAKERRREEGERQRGERKAKDREKTARRSCGKKTRFSTFSSPFF